MNIYITSVLLGLGVVAFARPPLEERRLIKTHETDPGKWLDREGISNLIQQNVNFIDITDLDINTAVINAETPGQIPSEIRFEAIIRQVISKIQQSRIESFVTHLSNYKTRYYTTDTAKESALWILSQIESHIQTTEYSGKASVATYEHKWKQPSIIARIEGQDPNLKQEVVILGAHLDSIAFLSSVAPGADDNGSGCSVLLETFRTLLESNFLPKRTIEFQFYAAEEIGLRGSGEIAQAYSKQGVQVVSMTNFDVVGYFAGRREIGIITDRTDAGLTQFLRKIVETFLSFKWTNKRCGYGCSDHASWAQYGYKVAFPVEIVTHPRMHTPRDTLNDVNFEQVVEFAKLGVAYTIELSQPLDV